MTAPATRPCDAPEPTIRLFGPPRLAVDGATVRVRNRRAYAVLARVVLAGRPVARDRLAQACWDDADPDVAAKSLRAVLSDLRRLAPGVLAITRTEVGLGPTAGCVDLVAFLDLIGSTGQEAVRPRGEEIDALAAAVALAQDDLLAGMDDRFGEEMTTWLEGERRYLAERAIEAHQALVDLLRREGRAEEAVASARALVARDPLREASHLTLVDAHLDLGQRTEALAQLERLRTTLEVELGLSPGPEVDEREVRARSESTVSPAVDSPLPDQRALVGRDALVDEISDVVAAGSSDRLVTLVGPGGVGKTSVAIAVAHRARATGRQVVFADLTTVDDPGDLFEVVGRALGVGRDYDPDTVAEALGDRPVLLVVDNLEHLLPDVVERLGGLVGATAATVLGTSRVPLQRVAERVVPVPPLDVRRDDDRPGPAVALFLRTATTRGARLGPDDVEIVTELCDRLDGLPLAIELAAARVRTAGLDLVATRIADEDLSLLRADDDRPDRHRDLGETVRRSVGLLDDASVDLLVVATVFPGPFPVDALLDAAWESVGDRDVFRSLASLVDLGLLRRDERDGATFFELVPALRGVARSLGDLDAAVLERRIDHDVALVRTARAEADAAATRRWHLRLDRYGATVLHTLDELVERGDDRALDVALGLTGFWMSRGRFGEGAGRIAAALASTDASDWRVDALALWRDVLRAEAVGFAVADDLIVDIPMRLDRMRDEAPPAELLWSIEVAVHALDLRNEPAMARPLVAEGVALAVGLDDVWAENRLRYAEAMLAHLDGDLDHMAALLRRVASESVAFGDPQTELNARMLLALSGIGGREGGQPDTLEELRDLAVAANDRRQVVWLTASLAAVSILDGRFADAGRWGAEALALAEASTYHVGIGFSLLTGAATAAFLGDPVTAARFHGAIEAELELIGRSMPLAYFEPYVVIAEGITTAAAEDPAVDAALQEGRQLPRRRVLALLDAHLRALATTA